MKNTNKNTNAATKLAKIIGVGIAAAALITFSSNTYAAKTSDFKLDCMAHYHVYDQVSYVIPAHHRVPDISGGGMIYEITALEGKDCEKLKSFYDMNIVLHQKLGSVKVPVGAIEVQSGSDIGKDLTEKVSQSFSYVSDYDNTLPLFPLVHQEYASLLGFSGKANAQKLYGVPAFSDLTDKQLDTVKDQILAEMDYGIIFADPHFHGDKEELMSLLTSLDFKNEVYQKEYLSDLLLAFNNAGKNTAHFVSFIPVVSLGQKVNQLIGMYGGTKWQTKMQIYSKNPNLFQEQIIAWSFNNDGKAPVLSTDEVEEYLIYTVAMIKKLKPVTEVYEAQILKAQYEQSADMIKKYTAENGMGMVHFDLTEKSQQLLEVIQQLKTVF